MFKRLHNHKASHGLHCYIATFLLFRIA